MYIEDAFGDRVWAEFGACKKLIDNINTIFDTRSSSGGGQGQVGVAKSSELGTQLVGLSETKGEDISEDAEEMEEEKGRLLFVCVKSVVSCLFLSYKFYRIISSV